MLLIPSAERDAFVVYQFITKNDYDCDLLGVALVTAKDIKTIDNQGILTNISLEEKYNFGLGIDEYFARMSKLQCLPQWVNNKNTLIDSFAKLEFDISDSKINKLKENIYWNLRQKIDLKVIIYDDVIHLI